MLLTEYVCVITFVHVLLRYFAWFNRRLLVVVGDLPGGHGVGVVVVVAAEAVPAGTGQDRPHRHLRRRRDRGLARRQRLQENEDEVIDRLVHRITSIINIY